MNPNNQNNRPPPQRHPPQSTFQYQNHPPSSYYPPQQRPPQQNSQQPQQYRQYPPQRQGPPQQTQQKSGPPTNQRYSSGPSSQPISNPGQRSTQKPLPQQKIPDYLLKRTPNSQSTHSHPQQRQQSQPQQRHPQQPSEQPQPQPRQPSAQINQHPTKTDQHYPSQDYQQSSEYHAPQQEQYYQDDYGEYQEDQSSSDYPHDAYNDSTDYYAEDHENQEDHYQDYPSDEQNQNYSAQDYQNQDYSNQEQYDEHSTYESDPANVESYVDDESAYYDENQVEEQYYDDYSNQDYYADDSSDVFHEGDEQGQSYEEGEGQGLVISGTSAVGVGVGVGGYGVTVTPPSQRWPYEEDEEFYYSETSCQVPKLPPLVPVPEAAVDRVAEIYETVHSLRSEQVELHVNAIYKLNEFVSESSKMEEYVIAAGGIQTIASRLLYVDGHGSVNRNTIIHLKNQFTQLLSKLSKSPHLNWTQVVVAVDYLVLYLSRGTSENPEHRKICIQVLRKIGQEEEAKVRFRKVGAFRTFFRLLQISEPDFKELSLKLMGLMFLNQKESVEEMIKEGMIHQVCELLQSPLTSLRTLAAGFIWAFSAFDIGREHCREAGAVPKLVNLFQDRDESVRWHAMGALVDMCKNNEENQLSFAVSGVLATIVQQIQQVQHQRPKKRLLDCLHSITYLSGPAVRKAVLDAGAHTVLQRIKEEGYDSRPVLEGIDSVLLNLSARNMTEGEQKVWVRPGEITLGKLGIYSGSVAEFHYSNGDVYKGAWANDRRVDGYGIMDYQNGERYEGDWKDGKRHGKGKWLSVKSPLSQQERQNIFTQSLIIVERAQLEFRDREEYDGHWYADQFHGEGTMRYRNGTVYSGSWRSNKRNGFGKCKYFDGSSYEGQWLDDQRHGPATAVFPAGETYRGEWVKDKPLDGRTSLQLKDGSTFYGNIINARRNGFGILTFPDRSFYIGYFKDNKRSGLGKFIETTENSNLISSQILSEANFRQKYFGFWSDDRRNGFGICYHQNGTVFQGEWKNDQKHGNGIETSFDESSSFFGTWRLDQQHGCGICKFPSGRYCFRDYYKGVLQKSPMALMELEPISEHHFSEFMKKLQVEQIQGQVENLQTQIKELEKEYEQAMLEKQNLEKKKNEKPKELQDFQQTESFSEIESKPQLQQHVGFRQPHQGAPRGRGGRGVRGGRGGQAPPPTHPAGAPPGTQSRGSGPAPRGGSRGGSRGVTVVG